MQLDGYVMFALLFLAGIALVLRSFPSATVVHLAPAASLRALLVDGLDQVPAQIARAHSEHG